MPKESGAGPEKKGQGEPARGQQVPFSGLGQAHTPDKSGVAVESSIPRLMPLMKALSRISAGSRVPNRVRC